MRRHTNEAQGHYDVDARYRQPLLGTFDPLGYLEVAGPIPAEEMGLRPRQRVLLVGTAYEPETVGEAYALHGAIPRFVVRDAHSPRTRRAKRPSATTAYQDRTTARIAERGEETHVIYRLHVPELAGYRVAMVTDVERRLPPPPLLIPAFVAACMALMVVGTVVSWHDHQAVRGHYVGKTDDEIRADLDATVDWDAMEISVANAMAVSEGETSVEARIENVEANHCDQKVRIYESDDPSDVLYESGAIAPGEYLQFVELAHPLSVGTHEVVVEFQGYERTPSLISDTGELLGHDTFGASCAAEVTIYCAPAA